MPERMRAVPFRAVRGYALLGIVIVAVLCWAPAFYSASPTQLENAKPGTTAWQLTNPATDREIEGYASLTSVNRGGQIRLFVNTAEATYTMRIFRMGWYGGAGAREMTAPINRTGTAQPMPVPDPATGLVDCNWTDPYVLSIPNSADPTEWASGIYLVQLTAGTSGKQSYIHFVVRDDARASNYLYQCSVSTYQAYNNWGGKSLYLFNSAGTPARKVSFNRPYAVGQDPAHAPGAGAGEFLTNLSIPAGSATSKAGWEYNMVRFLEREGYDVSYCTNLDTHADPNLLLPHKGFLSVGHDEYWTTQMRANIESARDHGVSLGFFGANACFWQIRLETSAATGGADRIMVGYKDFALTEDPLALDGNPANDYLITRRWRETPLNRPEDALIGVMYEFDPVNADMVITNAGHWICAGTGLVNGAVLPGLVGYEVDRYFGNAPANTVLIAHSPYQGGAKFSDMSVYTAASGATVFAVGSMQWSWGLDNYNAPALRPTLQSTAAQQMTRNVLAAFMNAPVPPPGPPATQNDDFNDNTRDTARWSLGTVQAMYPSGSAAWDPAVAVLEQNARLEITPRAGQSGAHFNGYLSPSSWDLTNGNASVEVVQVGGGGSTDTQFAVSRDAQNFCALLVERSRLYFMHVAAGVESTTSVAYVPTLHRFWRLRHDSGANTILFETSADRVAWTVQRTVSRAFALTQMRVEMNAGTWEPVTTPGMAVFDNFRLELAAPPANLPPLANAGGPYAGTIAQAVSFSGSGSSDPDGSISTYQWSFGDSTAGTGATPTHSYATAGSYPVTLTVTDNRGATASATTTVTISAMPNQNPVARPGGPYTGTAGQAVVFNGTASSDADGTVAAYQWNFGDGATGTGATPSHAYATAGTYTVTLTVIDNRGGAHSAGTTVIVGAAANLPPIAAPGGPYSGVAGTAVAFNGSGSVDPDGSIAAYQWSFGDGTTGTGASTPHSYAAAGSYNVTLTVTDNRGASTTAGTLVVIAAAPAPGLLTDDFNDNARDVLKWELGALQTPADALVPVREQNQRLEIAPRAAVGGIHYNGYLSAAGWDMTNAAASVEVVQVANGTANSTLLVGNDAQNYYMIETESGRLYFVQVLGGVRSETSVAYNAAQHRYWRLRHDAATNAIAFETSADRSAWTTQRSLTRQMAITAAEIELSAGAWQALSNPGTAIFDNFRLDLNGALPPNQSPVARPGGPYTGTVGQSVAFNGGTSSDPDGSITSYQWSFGDGGTATGATPTRSFAAAGTYSVTLTVTDNRGATNSASTTVTITAAANQAPIANASGPYAGTAGQVVTFNGAGSLDPDGTIAGYQWSFGDGGTGTGAMPTRTYTAAGTYTATLTVTDNRGATASASAVVTIAPAPPPGTLSDDFNDNARDALKWSLGSIQATTDAAVPVLEQNQRLEIAPRANVGGIHFNGYVSASTGNLTNAAASVEVIQVANGTADTILMVGSDAQNFYMIETESGRLYFAQVVAGVRTETSVAYNAAQHRYWRIRHDGATNTVAFETSADRVTWTTQRSVVRQLAITAVRVELSAGTWQSLTAPGTAIFDNFRWEGN